VCAGGKREDEDPPDIDDGSKVGKIRVGVYLTTPRRDPLSDARGLLSTEGTSPRIDCGIFEEETGRRREEEGESGGGQRRVRVRCPTTK
jgi:hypothetical protein